MKPTVEFVRKNLDTAIEIMSTLHVSIETSICVKVRQIEQRVCNVVASQTEKKGILVGEA